MKIKLILGLALVTPFGSSFADVPVKAHLCNQSLKPVEFHLFNHNDITSGAGALTTKALQACSCAYITTNTDLWHNMPIARINQLVYRDVGSVSGTSIKVCVDAKGKFEGYVEGGVKTCVEAKKETSFLPAPELTRAQGDLKILQSHLHANSTDCTSKDWTNGCSYYSADYTFSDGVNCFGN